MAATERKALGSVLCTLELALYCLPARLFALCLGLNTYGISMYIMYDVVCVSARIVGQCNIQTSQIVYRYVCWKYGTNEGKTKYTSSSNNTKRIPVEGLSAFTYV